MKIDPRINQLYSTIPQSHAQNLNKEAFNDIANVLLSFHDKALQSHIKEVCDASPGHGKSSAIISYLKWITKHHPEQPILLATREKQLAQSIYKEVSYYSPLSVINIDAENKFLYEHDLSRFQIVIIQQQRLKNFGLGYGELNKYKHYKYEGYKIKRLLIIDEKPDFIDSVIFDINSTNNVLDWFEDLSEPIQQSLFKIQKFKSFISFLLSEQLADNNSSHTINLINNYKDMPIVNELISILDEMEHHEDNIIKYDSLNSLKHFKKLMHIDYYGRIDNYSYFNKGRKIIVSKLIDYENLDMNLLVFDGTLKASGILYSKTKFKGYFLENRNNYKRLNYHIEEISTTKYSRNKKDNPTQKAISKRIKELRKIHEDLFVLPMKEEIEIYLNEGAIKESDRHLYFDQHTQKEKGINLLNTTGKNILENKTSLYLTCLPKRNADYYKCIAIAIYGNEVDLMMSEDKKNTYWFYDNKLESVYRHELYGEMSQIMHRTKIRKLNDADEINIYIAYDEESINQFKDRIDIISETINSYYFKKEANINPSHKIIDMNSYGRDKKILEFINMINEAFEKDKRKRLVRISKIDKKFQKFINNHWETKSSEINSAFIDHGYKIVIKKDRYSSNSKYIYKV